MGEPKLYNTASAAEELKCSAATVSRWVKRLSLGKRHGPSVILNKKDVETIRKHKHGGPGNPDFGKSSDN